MTEVYHGSLEVVKTPEIRQPVHTLDYGAGFYLTTSYEQAERWTRRRMDEKGAVAGYVNVYELDSNALQGMKSLIFEKATEEWVNFVMKNRIDRTFNHDYDVVYGPVANDRVYTQFALYEGGFISLPTLLHELKTFKLVDQYLLHTERSLDAIKFIESKEIRL